MCQKHLLGPTPGMCIASKFPGVLSLLVQGPHFENHYSQASQVVMNFSSLLSTTPVSLLAQRSCKTGRCWAQLGTRACGVVGGTGKGSVV